MSLTNLQIFNQFTRTTALELLAQQIQLFNTASQGTIVLRGSANKGDFSDETFYQRIVGLVRRRDAYGSGAVSSKSLVELLKSSVKVAAGTPPVNIDPGWWNWIGENPEIAGAQYGKQLGEEMLADMLNTALKAYVAALSNVGASVVYDGTAGKPTLNVLNRGAQLFGDRASAIQCWVMHSTSWHDLVDAALTNTAQLFQFGTVSIQKDALGRPYIVTDAPDLFDATPTPDNYRILGLTSGAMVVEQNPDYTENIETKNGTENITRTIQSEWSYNLGLKGYTWDKSNGGASPTNAALGTGSNWDKVATSHKDTAGVLIKTQ